MFIYDESRRDFCSLLGGLRVQIQGNHTVRVGFLYLQKMRLEIMGPWNEVLADGGVMCLVMFSLDGYLYRCDILLEKRCRVSSLGQECDFDMPAQLRK